MSNGEFYTCDDFYLLIYENINDAKIAYNNNPTCSAAAIVIVDEVTQAMDLPTNILKHWTEYIKNKKAFFSTPKEPFFLVQKEDIYWNVIVGKNVGWIIFEPRLKLKEFKKDEK